MHNNPPVLITHHGAGEIQFHSVRDVFFAQKAVTWSKEDELTPIRYYDMDGDMITLNTGMTYVALIPDDLWSGLEIK